MDLDQFRILRELESHHIKIAELNEELKEELKRIPFLQRQISNKNIRLLEIDPLIEQKQLDLTSHDQKLNQQEMILKKLIDKSYHDEDITEQKQTLEKDIIELEDQGLSLLEDIESLEAEKIQINGFLEGVKKTIIEIETDICHEQKVIDEKIASIQKRIQNLYEQLPQNVVSTYQLISKKYLGKALTRLKSYTCQACFIKVDNAVEEEIERRMNLVQCPGCQRIILHSDVFNQLNF